MIPVIVATHDDGVVRVYLRHLDGEVTQTARFVANVAFDPPTLAALVANMADDLFWNGAKPEPVLGVIPRPNDWTCPDCGWVGTVAGKGGHIRQNHLPAISPGTGKTAPKKIRRAGRDEMQRQRDDMLTWLTAHDGVTASDAADAMPFPKRKDKAGAARKLLDQLVDRGLAAKTPSPYRNGPAVYSALVHIPAAEQ